MSHQRQLSLTLPGLKIQFWPNLQHKLTVRPVAKKSGVLAEIQISPLQAWAQALHYSYNDAAPEPASTPIKAAASKGEDEGSGIGWPTLLGALLAGLIWYFIF